MENRKKTLGFKKRTLNSIQDILLLVMLHSTFIAPSQNMIDACFNSKEALYYKGADMKLTTSAISNSGSNVLNSIKKPFSLSVNSSTKSDSLGKSLASYSLKSDIK